MKNYKKYLNKRNPIDKEIIDLVDSGKLKINVVKLGKNKEVRKRY